MNSHFQSSETTWISTGAAFDSSGRNGSRAWEPNQAMPPRNVITSAGIAQTINSIWPENDQYGRYVARSFVARNHQAKPSVAAMTGTTITSMIASESMR